MAFEKMLSELSPCLKWPPSLFIGDKCVLAMSLVTEIFYGNALALVVV